MASEALSDTFENAHHAGFHEGRAQQPNQGMRVEDPDETAAASCEVEYEHFNEALSDLLCEGCVLPEAGFREAAEMMVKRVHEVALHCFGPRLVCVRPFGSFVQDTCILGSDVDICIYFADGQEPQKHAEIRDCLWRVGCEIRRPRIAKYLELVEEIFEATVPILRVRSLETCNIEADISFGIRQQTPCDEMVRSWLAEKSVAKQCVLLIKYWAQRELVNKAYHGFPSSFSWVLLAIFYLKHVGALTHPLAANSHTSLFELIVGFFAFCMSAELRDRWIGLSVDHGSFIKLNEPVEAIFIEVPGEPLRNAARCLRLDRWALVLQKVEAMRGHLASSPTRESLQALILGHQEPMTLTTDPYGGEIYGEEDYAEPWADEGDEISSEEGYEETWADDGAGADAGGHPRDSKDSPMFIEIVDTSRDSQAAPRPPPPSVPKSNHGTSVPQKVAHSLKKPHDSKLEEVGSSVSVHVKVQHTRKATDTAISTSSLWTSSPQDDTSMPAMKMPRLAMGTPSDRNLRSDAEALSGVSQSSNSKARVIVTNAADHSNVGGEVDYLLKVALMKARLTSEAEAKVKKLGDHAERLTRSIETLDHSIEDARLNIVSAEARTAKMLFEYESFQGGDRGEGRS